MALSDSNQGPSSGNAQSFATTHWSVVLAASDQASPQAAAASLETLCRAYWFPLYFYVRRDGHCPHDAQDLTQEFSDRLLAKNYLGQVDRAKGRFRSFLLASMKHFLANERDRSRTMKRGGEISFVPSDDADVERQLRFEGAQALPAEALYRSAMQRSRAIVVVVFCSFLACAHNPPAASIAGTGEISGTVKTLDGLPLFKSSSPSLQ